MNRFKISPGEEALKAAFENEKSLEGPHQQFSSFPTAFVVAADIELSVSFLIRCLRRAITGISCGNSTDAENSSREIPPSSRAPFLLPPPQLTYLLAMVHSLFRDRTTRPSPNREPRWSPLPPVAGKHCFVTQVKSFWKLGD